MRNKIAGFAICIAILGTAVLVFFNIFEIVEDEKYIPPSREASVNQYLALDRWLVSRGYKIRVQNYGNSGLFSDAEGIIFIQSDLIKWDSEIIHELDLWINNGGHLILSLDFYRDWDDENALVIYLYSLGLTPGSDPEGRRFNYSFDINAPSYGRNVYFDDTAGASLVLRDENDFIRLVEFEKGRGKISVTGRTRFMTSSNLNHEPNSRLSWYLFSGAKNNSILFIRGEAAAAGFMRRFFRRGNFPAIIASALALIAVGFWSAIPVFGVVRNIESGSGKNLAERFLAEGNFLWRFGSADTYRLTYLREIKRKLAAKKHSGIRTDDIADAASEIIDERHDRISKAVEKTPRNKKEFTESITILKTILERI